MINHKHADIAVRGGLTYTGHTCEFTGNGSISGEVRMDITDRHLLLKARVESCGFMNSAEIAQDSIVYDKSFRDICLANQCGEMGRCWMCPPDVGELDELIAKCRSYPYAILYQSYYQLEDSLDIEGMQEGKKQFTGCAADLTELLYAMQEEGMLQREDYMQLGVGACGICDTCAKRENKPCRYPMLALPSMEACGIFVSETAKNAGLKYINGENTVTYFGMLLFR